MRKRFVSGVGSAAAIVLFTGTIFVPAAGAASDDIVVAIDPGHTSVSHADEIDPITGVKMSSTSNGQEDDDVFYVAEKVRNELESDGYEVVMLKETIDEDMTFRERVDRAADADADIGISIHTTPGDANTGEVYNQFVGGERYSPDRSTVVTFDNEETAEKSTEYSEIMAEARQEVEGTTVEVTKNSFDGRESEGKWGGDLPVMSLLSEEVPWTYHEFTNENGQGGVQGIDGSSPGNERPNADRYAEGIIAGVKAVFKDSGGSDEGGESASPAREIPIRLVNNSTSSNPEGSEDAEGDDGGNGNNGGDDDGGGSAQCTTDGFSFPTDESATTMTSPFGPRWGTNHNGMDYAGPLGTPLYAFYDGEVVAAADSGVPGFGGWVVLDHEIDGKQIQTVYGHSDPGGVHVSVGDKVKAGDHISDLGNSGQSTGPHLHFEVIEGDRASGGQAVNPATWIERAKGSTPADCNTGSSAGRNSDSDDSGSSGSSSGSSGGRTSSAPSSSEPTSSSRPTRRVKDGTILSTRVEGNRTYITTARSSGGGGKSNSTRTTADPTSESSSGGGASSTPSDRGGSGSSASSNEPTENTGGAESDGGRSEGENLQEAIYAAAESAASAAKEDGITMDVVVGDASSGNRTGDAGKKVYPASVIKIAVAAAALKDGAVDAGDSDLAAMITRSDNEATNRIVEKVGGMDKVNDLSKGVVGSGEDITMANLMMSGSFDSTANAGGMASLLQEIYDSSTGKGDLLEKDKAQAIIDLMKQQQVTTKLGKGLSVGTQLANKTGEYAEAGVSHDVGYLFSGDKVYTIAVFTSFSPGQDGFAKANSHIVSLSNDIAGLL